MNETMTYSVVVNGKTLEGEVAMSDLRDVLFDMAHDTCIGECECTVEPDGHCPSGYPSHSLAVGII